MPFIILFILLLGMFMYLEFKKNSGYSEPLWRLIFRCLIIVTLSTGLFLNGNLGPTAKKLVLILGTIITVLTLIQIFKKIKTDSH